MSLLFRRASLASLGLAFGLSALSLSPLMAQDTAPPNRPPRPAGRAGRSERRGRHDQRPDADRGRPCACRRRAVAAVRADAARTAPRGRAVGGDRNQGHGNPSGHHRPRQGSRLPAPHGVPAAARPAWRNGREGCRRQGHGCRGSRPLRPGNRQHTADQRSACPSHPREDEGRG